MAIPFLNNIDLSDNQLLNAKLQITGTAPAAEQGQVYFNSATGFLKPRVYDGAAWLNILDTTSVISGTYVSSTVTSNVDLTLDLSAVDGTSTAASRFLTKDNEWATIPFGDITAVLAGTYINIDDSTGPEPTVNHDLTTRPANTTSTATPAYGATFTVIDSVTTNTTGHVTSANTKTVTMPAAEAYAFSVTADTGTDQPIDSGDTLDIAGGTNISTVVGATDTVTVNLDDSISLAGSLTVTTTGNFTGQVTIPQVPTADTDAASKHYVDQAVTGALSYQGAYDAATNTPDLDSSPSSDIKTGWTYTVTVEGLFFTEQVRVGDVLIANNNAPTTLAEWTTVQNNIDLADASTVGIGNVVPGASNTITAPYTNGTATLDVVDSTAAQKGAVIVSAGTGISVAYVAGEATVTNTETNANNSKTGTITAGNLSGTVTHTFGINTIVQTISSSGDTVYCDVTRTATTSVATIAAVEATDITILVQKIG